MKKQTSEELQKATSKLLELARSTNVLSKEVVNSHMKLVAADPETVRGATIRNIFNVGFEKLYMEHGDFMTKLQSTEPLLCKFITRSRLVLKVKTKDIKYKRTNLEQWSTEDLVSAANQNNLINLEESIMYMDLIAAGGDNRIYVELDILRKVEDLNYMVFKEAYPLVLDWVKFFYEDWYAILLKPHEEYLKNKLENGRK